MAQLHTFSLSSPNSSLLDGLQQAYAVDSFTQQLLEDLAVNQLSRPDWTQKGNNIFYKHRLYIPRDSPITKQIIIDSHDRFYGGHSGINATLHRIQNQFTGIK